MADNIQAAAGANQSAGALSGGGQRASGSGGADGSAFRHAGSGGVIARPRFDQIVPNGGYRWWYVDGLSDDGAHGLTIIAFVGSVFSPYYAHARRKGLGDAENHCAINVALYGGTKRWAMTERGKVDISRTESEFVCGPSSMRMEGDDLVITISERCAPLPRRITGVVRVKMPSRYSADVMLDDKGLHYWRAVAPHARIDVQLVEPHLRWQGRAYHDMNWGSEPLERGFREWTWSRLHDDNAAVVFYDAQRTDHSRKAFAMRFEEGAISETSLPPRHSLKRGFWGMAQDVRSEVLPMVISKLEDAPFYTRNHVLVGHGGKLLEAFQESLSLEKFDNKLVQMMLPFRMPRSLSVS
jgi:carotenoid 1,2-hydratase